MGRFFKRIGIFLMAVVMGATFIGCETNDNGEDNTNGTVLLSDVYDEYFPMGAALGYSSYKRYASDENLIEHFSSMTCENEMKWESLQNTKGNFNFAKSKEMVEFAKERGMLVRGHALVWHSQLPSWVTSSNDKTTILTNIEEHIERVVTEFGDDIYAWDVVNEALSDDGGVTYRQSPFYTVCGTDYIKTAFKKAREVNPNIKLYYNDYNLDQPAKRAKMLTLIDELQAEGIPIDGIGMQGHYNIADFNFNDFKKSVDSYLAKGLDVQLTEVDISIYSFSDSSKKTALSEDDDAKQANLYKQIFQYLRELKKDGKSITGVTLWGVADDYTWLHNFPVLNRRNFPMLFDEDHQKKTAFYEIVNFDGIVREKPIEKPVNETENQVQGDFAIGQMELDGSISSLNLNGNKVTFISGQNNGDYQGVKWNLTNWNLAKQKHVKITIKNDTNVVLTGLNYKIVTDKGDGYTWPIPPDIAAGGSDVFTRESMTYDMSLVKATNIKSVYFWFKGKSAPIGSVTFTIEFSENPFL